MSELYASAACRAARQDCIDRKGVCGRDCPHALESMRWRCMIREMPEVVVAIGQARYLEKREARKAAKPKSRYASKAFPKRTVFAILDALANGVRARDLARQYGVNDSTISLIKSGTTYRGYWLEWREQRQQAG